MGKVNKFLILAILAVQTAAHILAVRFSRSTGGTLYLSNSVVTLCELCKLVVSIAVVFRNCDYQIKTCSKHIYKECFSDWKDLLKMMLPGVLYTLQNNLLYVGLENLPAATYQVLYQLKILTTALFSWLMLNRRLHLHQWLSVFILFLGVIFVDFAGAEEKENRNSNQNEFLGASVVVISSLSSGFAGVWFERMLKFGKRKEIWLANIQLAAFGILMGLLVSLIKDRDDIVTRGYFHGFTPCVYFVVVLQGAGGLLVSMVVKYADNILKGFACAAAIIGACIGSCFLFHFQINAQFMCGTFFVIAAIVIYNQPQSQKAQNKHT